MIQGRTKNKPSRTSIPLRRKLVYSLIVTALFFVAVESLLAVIGVQPTIVDRDPYVGFESTIPLFVERQTEDGVFLQTAENKLSFFNPQRFAKQKPANTIRIFCVGGSTTFGRPYDDRTSFAGWLREMLPLADQRTNWEVVNAGGISYASYRVAALMEELTRYSPDLFIVYTGHNEFLEERTYGDLQSISPTTRRMTALLHRSRTFSLAHRLLESRTGEGDLRELLPSEVDAILDHSVGPEDYHRDPSLRASVLKHFEFNLARIADTARDSGAGVIFVTPASNLKDFSPFKSEPDAAVDNSLRQRWTDAVVDSRRLEAEGDREKALQAIEVALSIDPMPADLHFELGRLQLALDQDEDARASFERAIDLDVCPLRAVPEIRQTVEDVAIEKRIPLVDFDGILSNDCQINLGHGSPGSEYFLDHVHPTISAHRLLALAIIQALTQAGVVVSDPNWGEAAIAKASRSVEERIDASLQARSLTNLAQVLSWAGKKQEAGRLAEQAVQLRTDEDLPDDPESMFYAAVSYAVSGQDAKAIELFQKVVALEPSNAQARWRLAALLYDQARYEEASLHFRKAVEVDPNDAHSYEMLGSSLMKSGNAEEALDAWTRALELDPGNTEIQRRIDSVRGQSVL